MKKAVNSALSLVITAAFCVAALLMVINQSEGSFSLTASLDVFVLAAVLLFTVFYFFKPVRFYFTILSLLIAYIISLMGGGADGRLLLAAALFFCMGATSVFVKTAYFFPLKKMGVPLIVWLVVFVLLNIVAELVSGGSKFGIPTRVMVVAVICGVVSGVVGMLVKAVTIKAYGVSVNRYYLVDAIAASRFLPKAEIHGAGSASPGVAVSSSPSVVVPKRSAAKGDDVKKSILDAKLAAMCGEQDDKEKSVADKSTQGGAQKVPAKQTTETGKIVSSVDFS